MALRGNLRFDIEGSMNQEAATAFKALLEAYNDLLTKIDTDFAAQNAAVTGSQLDVDYSSTLAVDID